MIGGGFAPIPRTLCGHYFSKHPAVLIMSILFLLSGLCLPRCLEGEASFLTRLQTSRAAATHCLRLRAPFKEISFELFQTVLFCAEGFAWPCAAVAINHRPGPSLSMSAVLQRLYLVSTLQSFYIHEGKRDRGRC